MEQVTALNQGPDALIENGIETPALGTFTTTRIRIKRLQQQGINVVLAPPSPPPVDEPKAQPRKGAAK